jgi:hypothetical protein
MQYATLKAVGIGSDATRYWVLYEGDAAGHPKALETVTVRGGMPTHFHFERGVYPIISYPHIARATVASANGIEMAGDATWARSDFQEWVHNAAFVTRTTFVRLAHSLSTPLYNLEPYRVTPRNRPGIWTNVGGTLVTFGVGVNFMNRVLTGGGAWGLSGYPYCYYANRTSGARYFAVIVPATTRRLTIKHGTQVLGDGPAYADEHEHANRFWIGTVRGDADALDVYENGAFAYAISWTSCFND